ncbi:MAG: peroxiredoxin [Euryarchaeota archaeon RBG_19FT_COMBO_56_21]|nr:MAG: peroxiredoxin [Euryarchaeota archaeon RBG_19FT_COMBO_56_21]
MKERVEVGDEAPDFTLPSQKGVQVSLKDFRGKKTVVLYFYPKDNTSGCTAEACKFRDSHQAFVDAGAEVIGISSQSLESHNIFSTEFHLPFHLLSDEGGLVRKLWGVPSSGGLLPGRVTYVIDKKGIVRHMFASQTDIEGHIEGALKVVRALATEEA